MREMTSLRFTNFGMFLLAGILGASFVLAPSTFAAEAADDTAASTPAESSEKPAEEPAEAEEEGPVPVSELTSEESNSYTINTLIMFVCAVLVLFMQAGFAMLEVGLNSAKNTVNILFKNVMDLSVGVILFLFVGYGLMYPSDWLASSESVETVDGVEETTTYGFLGKPSALVTNDITEKEVAGETVQFSEKKDFSNPADFLFQVAFAATAATIVSGAVAGRMKFGAYLVYSAILTGLIYPISGAWKWGGGFLDAMGFQDFAGSVVVHAVGGFAGLAGAIVLGARLGRFTKDGKSVPMPGHNIAFAALGVFILWVGWYGFNPGSQLTYDGVANANATTWIALTTTISAAVGAVVAMISAWVLFGKPDVTMALNGALAGLVGITANCDRVSQIDSLIIGAVAGLLVVAGIILLDKLRIDDPVGAWPVHGLCGVWGGIATGIFGTVPDGMTRGGFITVQCIATVVICAWAFITMFGVFLALKAAGMLRVSPEEESAGLDVSEHGMHAYPPSLVADYSPAGSVPAPASTKA